MTSAWPAGDTAPAFGTLLRRRRLAAGLTQEELAECAHLSKRSISDIERGVPHTPRKDTVALLADALALTPADRCAFVEAARRRGTAPPLGRTVAPPHPSAPPFVGRAGELALLERHLAGAGPPLLLLAGEPGIGKTRLLHAAIPRAVAQGLLVLEGGCQRRGGQEPYAPLLDALQRHIRGRRPVQLRTALQGCAWLVRLLPELSAGPIPPLPAWTLTPEQERRLMTEAVVRFLTNVAGPAGTLLLLDDLQWAGPDALDLLATLARAAAEVPLRVIATYRDTEVQPHDPLSALLADLAQAGLAARRLLGPLAPQEAAQLLAAVLGTGEAEECPLRAQVLRRGGGVPFFVLSCAQVLRRDGGAEAGGEAVPWDVGQSVQQRVVALPEDARDLIGMAAVVGRVVPRPLLNGVAARPEEEVVAALEALCHARLLEDQGGETYQFAHDVIREVIEADLGTARRILLHRRVARVLEQEDDPSVEALAYHYTRAHERAAAAHWLERAGDRAAAGFANATALEHFAAARAHLLDRNPDAAGVSRLDEKLGDVHLRVGDLLVAQEDFARARAGEAQAARRAELRYKEAQTYRWRNDFPRALAAFAAAEAEGSDDGGGGALPRALLAEAAASRGEIYTWQSNYAAAQGAAEHALTLLAEESAGTASELARSSALFVQGQVAAARGEHGQATALYRAALDVQERSGDQEQLHRTLLYWGALAYNGGRFADAEQCLRRALAISTQIGNQLREAVCWQGLATAAHLRGDLDRAEDWARTGLRLSERVGHQGGIMWAWWNLGQVALLRGALDEAAVCFQHQEAVIAATQRSPAGPALGLGLVACAHGDLVAAAARCRAARRRSRQDGDTVVEASATIAQAHVRLRQRRPRAAAQLLAWGSALADTHGWGQPGMQAALLHVELLLYDGEHDAAQAAAEAALRRASDQGRRFDEALARRLRGQCTWARGDNGTAERDLRSALALQTEIGAHLEGARTRLALAVTLMHGAVQKATVEEAHTLLAAARSQFTASGAKLDLAQAEYLAASWALD